MSFDFFSRNGDILPISEATVSLNSIEYTYGFGVYETLRVNNHKPLFLEDHINRLIISADIIKLEHSLSKDVIEKNIKDLITKTVTETFNVKILLIGASKKENASLYILCSNPLFLDRKLYRDGVEVIISNYERVYPQAKSLNMLQSYMSYKEAQNKKAYDSLLINRDGYITEGTRTNFFAIKDMTIYSAPENQILLGVTRKNILDVALRNGYKIEERSIKLDNLKDYDGAFLTSTSTKIVPIRKVIDFQYDQIPEALNNLMKLFDDFLDANK